MSNQAEIDELNEDLARINQELEELEKERREQDAIADDIEHLEHEAAQGRLASILEEIENLENDKDELLSRVADLTE